MIITEKDAAKVRCPMAIASGELASTCYGAGCMAWRWATPPLKRDGPFPDDAPLADLELSVRAINACAYAGLETVGDVRSKTDTELKRYKMIGAKTLKELRAMTHDKPSELRLGFCGMAGKP